MSERDLALLGRERARALAEARRQTDALREAVVAAAARGCSEVEIAREAGVTRMTVRAWLGKRAPVKENRQEGSR